MAIQIQIKPLGRGFGPEIVWSIYGEFRGHRLPKYASKYADDLRRDRVYDVRIIRDTDQLFIKEYNGTSAK